MKNCLAIILCGLLIWCQVPAHALVVGYSRSISTEPTGDFKTDLYGYWDLDAPTNPLNDMHNSNNLTNNGADDVTGGYQFIAANSDYMTAPMALFDESKAISLFLRVKFQTPANYTRIAHYQYNNTGYMIMYRTLGPSIQVITKCSDGTWGGETGSIATFNVSNDTLYNMVFVFSQGSDAKNVVRVYVDGSEEVSRTQGSAGTSPNKQEAYLGSRNPPDSYSNILVEKWALWERELTSQECVDINTNYDYAGW